MLFEYFLRTCKAPRIPVCHHQVFGNYNHNYCEARKIVNRRFHLSQMVHVMLHEQHHSPFKHRREQLDVLVACALFLRSTGTLYPILWLDQHTSAIYTSLIQVLKSGSIQCWTGLNTSSHSAPRLLQNLLLGNKISHNNINFFSQSRRSEQLPHVQQ